MARLERDKVDKVLALFRHAAPGSGSYSNESDYFDRHWQNDFWGVHYARLHSIKLKYDPHDLFACHHCISSKYTARH